MGNKPKAPAPLDANAVAASQRQENQRAAAQNIAANRVNQTDQFGNTLNWQQTGTDAQGNPTYSANQQLGQQGQQLLGGLSGLAGQYFQGAGDLLNTPLDANQEVADQIYNLGQQRLAPRMDRQRAALETRLANQGINIGSEAYSNAMGDFGQMENDAFNQLALTGQGQAFQQSLAGRQQRVGELGGLAGLGVSGMGQTLDPSYVQAPQVHIPGVDVAGLQQMQHGQQMAAYQQKLQDRNAMMGGLAGLGGTLLTLPVGGIGGAAAGAGTAAAAGAGRAAAAGSIGGNALANIFPGIFR